MHAGVRRPNAGLFADVELIGTPGARPYTESAPTDDRTEDAANDLAAERRADRACDRLGQGFTDALAPAVAALGLLGGLALRLLAIESRLFLRFTLALLQQFLFAFRQELVGRLAVDGVAIRRIER